VKTLSPSSLLLLGVSAAALVASSCRPPETVASIEPEPSKPIVEYVTTQEILTPLPLRVRLPTRYGAERVLVLFRTWGSSRWESLELARAGQTWTGEVSCRAVSTITGDTDYFFVAVNNEDRPVIGSGWPEWPHAATVIGELPEGPHSLAGMPAPLRCHDPADCPPDFPGCPEYAVRRPACRFDSDCRTGRRCDWDGYCSAEAERAGGNEELATAIQAALHLNATAARYSPSD
jgi:hypothetical protein